MEKPTWVKVARPTLLRMSPLILEKRSQRKTSRAGVAPISRHGAGVN